MVPIILQFLFLLNLYVEWLSHYIYVLQLPYFLEWGHGLHKFYPPKPGMFVLVWFYLQL